MAYAMMLKEEIPGHHQAPLDAAVAWVNEQRGTDYELTGLAAVTEPEAAEQPIVFGLVLCDGEICAREDVLVQADGDNFSIDFAPAAKPDIPPLLDPPVGVRANWLDQVLEKFEFVLLLYYRGRW